MPVVTIRMRLLTYTLPACHGHSTDVHLLCSRPVRRRFKPLHQGVGRELCGPGTGRGGTGADVAHRVGSTLLAPRCGRGDDGPVTIHGQGLQAAAGVVRSVPTGAVYTILLMLHVLCAVVGFGTMVATGVQAARARRGPGASGADGVRRYFRPGVNWAGRTLYGVPVFGFALIQASQGAFSSGDGFVVVGLLVWLAASLLAEGVLWPGERRIQAELPEGWGDRAVAPTLDRDCRLVAATAAVLAVLFVTATVFMIGKP